MHCAFRYNSRPSAHSALIGQWCKKLGFFCLLLALSLSTLHAAEGDSPAAVPATSGIASATNLSDAAIGSNDVVQAYFQLQDQILATQLAVEHSRQEFQR